MRTTSLLSLAALTALATTALASCASNDRTNDTRNVDVEIENDGVSVLATDSGTLDGGGGSAGPVHQFKATSDVATAFGGNGWDSQFFLRAGKGTDGKVHLDFSSMQVDQTSWTCFPPPPWWDPTWPPPPPFCGYTRRIFTYAYGTLPNTSYRSGQGYAYLNATLVDGPALTVSSCTLDETTWTTTCAAGAGGTVDVRWKSSGWYSSTQTGSNEKRYGSFRFRTSGSLTIDGANVMGSVLGISADGSFGEMVRSTGAAIAFDAYFQP
jgi:hypothetical protein